VWADASGNAIILMGLSPGPHKVLIELEDANHHTLDKGTIKFVVPEKGAAERHHRQTKRNATNGPFQWRRTLRVDSEVAIRALQEWLEIYDPSFACPGEIQKGVRVHGENHANRTVSSGEAEWNCHALD
jgi:hypothetical protein